MNNRTSVTFARPSTKPVDFNDYSELILEEDEIESSENEQENEHTLGIMMKVKINNRSVADDEMNTDNLYGTSNADTNLQYNNQYFEDMKNKKRELMYSKYTRLSIRKFVKKMENNIMKKISKGLYKV